MEPTCPRCGSDAAVTRTSIEGGTRYTCRFSHGGEGQFSWTVAAGRPAARKAATPRTTTTTRAASPRTPRAPGTTSGSSRTAPPARPTAPALSVNERGIAAVVQEITRRGGHARVEQDGSRREVVVTGDGAEGEVRLVVRARTAGDWQTRASFGQPRAEEEHPTTFWVLVHLGPGAAVRSYVVPEWWMQNDISERHDEYLRFRQGTRSLTPESDHHAINTERVAQWLDRWDQLTVLPSDPD